MNRRRNELAPAVLEVVGNHWSDPTGLADFKREVQRVEQEWRRASNATLKYLSDDGDDNDDVEAYRRAAAAYVRAAIAYRKMHYLAAASKLQVKEAAVAHHRGLLNRAVPQSVRDEIDRYFRELEEKVARREEVVLQLMFNLNRVRLFAYRDEPANRNPWLMEL